MFDVMKAEVDLGFVRVTRFQLMMCVASLAIVGFALLQFFKNKRNFV